MNNNLKLDSSMILKDATLISVIITNLFFSVLFLIKFLKCGFLLDSIKFAFLVSIFIFIGVLIISYILIDISWNNQIEKIEDSNIKKKVQNNDSARNNNSIGVTISNTELFKDYNQTIPSENSTKSSSFSDKTQFNPDFDSYSSDLLDKLEL